MPAQGPSADGHGLPERQIRPASAKRKKVAENTALLLTRKDLRLMNSLAGKTWKRKMRTPRLVAKSLGGDHQPQNWLDRRSLTKMCALSELQPGPSGARAERSFGKLLKVALLGAPNHLA